MNSPKSLATNWQPAWAFLPIEVLMNVIASIFPWRPARRAAFCAAALALAASAASAECNKAAFRIVLDPGHTEEEPGAISARGVPEFTFNVNLAKDIEAALRKEGYEKTDLLITKGRGRWTLHARPAYANKIRANLFLSIHHDSVQDFYLEKWEDNGEARSFSDRYSGFSILVSNNHPNWRRSLQFASTLGHELQNRGLSFTKHHAENVAGERHAFLDPNNGVYLYKNLVVLRESLAPSVLLEAGVIVNRNEELEIAKPEKREAIASAAVAAVNTFCGAPASGAKGQSAALVRR